MNLPKESFYNSHKHIIVWMDGDWCYGDEQDNFAHKTGDYEVHAVPVGAKSSHISPAVAEYTKTKRVAA